MTAPNNQHHFERRSRAAREGRHLPTLDELLRGSPFMGDSVTKDAQAFAERLLSRLPVTTGDALAGLRIALEALTVTPTALDFCEAQSAFLAVHKEQDAQDPFADFNVYDLDEKEAQRQRQRWMWRCKGRVPYPEEHAVRCALYATCSGHKEAGWLVAVEAASMALTVGRSETSAYALHALGWLSVVAPLLPSASKRLQAHLGYSRRPESVAKHIANRLADRLDTLETLEAASGTPKRGSIWESLKKQAVDEETEDEPASPPEPAGGGVLVMMEIGNAETSDGKKVVREFEKLTGKLLPLIPLPDLAAVRRTLAAEFPYAVGVIDAVLNPMAASDHVRFRPTILVGDPGCGKTTFAERLLEELGAESETYSCGGVSDSAIAGTPRRWSTGEPSLPVALIRRWKTASPGIVLDEVEKTGTSRHNGHMLDALLGLLEPRSSTNWHDPYVEAAVDLSHVLWVCTANSMEGVPGPMRDRCRIIRFPSPRPADLDMLASTLVGRIVADQGLDPRWARPLDGEELDALRDAWPGGSVRRLYRLVEGVMAVRGQEAGVQ